MRHTTIKSNIKLMSDGEPGTGLGGENQNSVSPRDHRAALVIRESHLKGLLREILERIELERGWEVRPSVRLFGETDQMNMESDAKLRFFPAHTSSKTTSKVTRTAISVHGVGKKSTLRTSEAIPCGTVFLSSLDGRFEPESIEDLAIRLALLSLPAIGGNRTRGSGLVRVSIDGESRTPSVLLRSLDKICLTKSKQSESLSMPKEKDVTLATECCVVELFFKADSPICCPELPDKTNVIATGFTIPASAVQGALLTRLNYFNPKLADALFAHANFRAWPLQPCAQIKNGDWPELDAIPTSLRVSLTHRAAKYSIDDSAATDFRDIALDGNGEGRYTEQKTAVSGAPLKASDGVLLVSPLGGRELWRANDMSHLITAHGVRNSRDGIANSDRNAGEPNRDRDGRNLFVVDSMSPMIWRGMVVMPKDAASALLADLKANPVQAMGKGRTVRGIGHLKARIVGDSDATSIWETKTDRTVLIVQSPIEIRNRVPNEIANDCLRREVQRWMALDATYRSTNVGRRVGFCLGGVAKIVNENLQHQ
jgi:CRISPR/Cas system CSM-associated protein Csm3 (group 7 of RAMP superfamily)